MSGVSGAPDVSGPSGAPHASGAPDVSGGSGASDVSGASGQEHRRCQEHYMYIVYMVRSVRSAAYTVNRTKYCKAGNINYWYGILIFLISPFSF